VAALLAGTAGTTFGLLRAEQRRAESDAALQLAEQREQETRQVADFQATILSEIDLEDMGDGIKDLYRVQVQAGLARRYVGESSDRRSLTPEEIKYELAEFDQRADAAQTVDVARRVVGEYVLAPAAEKLEEEFGNQPLVQAQLHLAIGRTYQQLGLYGDAEPHFRAALEIRQLHYGSEQAHPEVAECLYELAGLLWYGDKVGEAETLYREALAMSRDLSNEHRVAMILQELGGVLLLQRRWDDADPLFNEALRINRELHGDDDRAVVDNLAGLAVLRTKQRRFPEAEELNRQVLEWRRQHFGHPHPKVAHVLYNLGQVLGSQGKHAEAEEKFREALAINRAVYGNEHHLVAKFLYALSTEIVDPDRRHEAEGYCRQALALQRELLGDHREVRTTLDTLSAMRQQAGDHDEAVELLRESLAIAERLYPDGNGEAWRRFSAMDRLARALNSQAKVLLDTERERALALFQEAAPLITACYDATPAGPNRRQWLEEMVEVFEFWNDVAPDRSWAEEAAEWRTELEKLDVS
ncbi:MAG: tetratricopeptide repeat protein, partial [Phycisphaerales bacterium]